MRSYLKEADVHIASLGESLRLRQLSAVAAMEVIALKDEPAKASATSIRYGVPAWSTDTADDIAASLTFEQMTEIQNAIQDIGASDPKSQRVRNVSSIST